MLRFLDQSLKPTESKFPKVKPKTVSFSEQVILTSLVWKSTLENSVDSICPEVSGSFCHWSDLKATVLRKEGPTSRKRARADPSASCCWLLIAIVVI